MNLASQLDTLQLLREPELWQAPGLPFLPTRQTDILLARYIDLLLKWNKSLNLTGCHDPLAILKDLLQDSFFLAHFLDNNQIQQDSEIWDLGAGAGLPGVPLRIIQNAGNYTWIECNQKRAIFLQTLKANLRLDKFQGFNGRVEKFFQTDKKADFIISRAFKPWHEILKLCEPKLNINGVIIFMANAAPPAMPDGWRLRSQMHYELPAKKRWLWAVAKHAPSYE